MTQENSIGVPGFVRDAFTRSNRTLAGAIALIWLAHRASSYPAQYLFILDSDIWFIQIGTWLLLAGEAVALGFASAIGIAAAQHLLRNRQPPSWATRAPGRAQGLLESRWVPLALGILSAAAAWYTWGTLRPTARVHDEAAYLLQANLYASGHWRAAAAPIPEFFEQMYVFVSPFFAAKYPPGFAISLVPGIWLGLPALMPALFVGTSGALLFTLARRVANPWIAFLTWVFSIGPNQLSHAPALMSEHLSTTLWLASWWSLLRWRDDAKTKHLLMLALFVSWGAITRPLSMLAAAVPIVFVVIRWTAKRRSWPSLVAAGGVGLAVLAILPLWSWRTTGDWKTSPLTLHIRWYTPYDTPGFGPAPQPIRSLPPDLEHVRTTLERARIRHTPAAIPRLIWERLTFIRADGFHGWRVALVPLAIFGLSVSGVEAGFAGLTCVVHFAVHLLIPHSPQQANYYFETYPVMLFCVAAGAWRLTAPPPAGSRVPDSTSPTLRGGSHASLALFLVACIGVLSVVEMRRAHASWRTELAGKARFRAQISEISSRKSVVFVRYSPFHHPDFSLIENEGDLTKERTWLVYDRGADNARLRAVAPERVPYLYDEASNRMLPLTGPMTTEQRRLVGASASPPASASGS